MLEPIACLNPEKLIFKPAVAPQNLGNKQGNFFRNVPFYWQMRAIPSGHMKLAANVLHALVHGWHAHVRRDLECGFPWRHVFCGQTVQLFTAGTYTGSFAATNLPAICAGLGLKWNPANGMVTFVQAVNTNPTHHRHRQWQQASLYWSVDHTGWRLQVQTNSLSSGLGTNWNNVACATATNQVNFNFDPAQGMVFYRMGYP